MKAFRKYSKIGGIESLYQQYKLGIITLTSLAKKLNVKPGTIYHDLIKLVGRERYLLDQENKKAARMAKKNKAKKFRTIKDGIDYLIKKQEEMAAKLLNIELTIRALKHIDSKLRKDIPIDLRRIKSPCLTTSNGEKISIRRGEVAASMSDFKTNSFRFNISKEIGNYQYVIVIIFFQNLELSYIFPTKKISHLRTLSLRYKNLDSNYKYKKAFKNWKLIS